MDIFYDSRVLMDWHLFSLKFFRDKDETKGNRSTHNFIPSQWFSQRTTLINRTDTRLIRTTERRTNHITNVFKLISTKVTIKNNSSTDYDLCPKVYAFKSVSKTLSVTSRLPQTRFQTLSSFIKTVFFLLRLCIWQILHFYSVWASRQIISHWH